jgi:hypothetical protein
MQLIHKKLLQILEYDPETGLWLWLEGKRTGYFAGSDQGRYNRIQIDGKSYMSGRLAWFYMTGVWPLELIDHKNRDSHDDRWDNLREATCQQNNFNRYDGVRGINKIGNRYKVMCGPNYYVGTFDTFEEAMYHRDSHAKLIAGEFAILNADLVNG